MMMDGPLPGRLVYCRVSYPDGSAEDLTLAQVRDGLLWMVVASQLMAPALFFFNKLRNSFILPPRGDRESEFYFEPLGLKDLTNGPACAPPGAEQPRGSH